MNHNSKKVKGNQVHVRHLGRHFHLHTFNRKKPRLKKLGPKQKPVSGVVTRYVPVRDRSLNLPRGHFPKRQKGGGLKNGSHFLPGQRRLITYLPFAPTVFQSIPGAFGDGLFNVSSVGGDFKKPNPQRFTHRVGDFYFRGSIQDDQFSNGKMTTSGRQEGDAIFTYVEPTFTAFPNSTVYNKALSRLYEKIRGDIDVSIDLAESHKTKSMMMQTVKAMTNLAVTFRKMKRSNPRDWGNLWLEYTYGWKPLVSTIYGAGSKLMAPTPQGMGFLRVTASAQEQVRRGTTTRSTGYASLTQYDRVSQVMRARFVVTYQLPSSVLTTLAGFTSLNPVSIAWELTPYSFVVDWFVNFGGYLRDFESALLYRTLFLDGYVTEGSLAQADSEIKGVDYNPSQSAQTYHRVVVDVNAFVRYTEKLRTVLNSSPFPRPPKFDPHLGASRLISGASLLGQMLTSLEHSKGWGHPKPSASEKRLANASFETASKAFTAWSDSMRVSLGRSRLRP